MVAGKMQRAVVPLLAALVVGGLAGCNSDASDGQQSATSGSLVTADAPSAAGSAAPPEAIASNDSTAAPDPGSPSDPTPAGGTSGGDDAAGAGTAADPDAAQDSPDDAMADSGDSGELDDAVAMPPVVGETVADARGLLSGIDVSYTDRDGAPVEANDQWRVCRQNPEPGTELPDGKAVLVVAESC